MTFVIVMGFHQIIVVMNDVKRHTYIHAMVILLFFSQRCESSVSTCEIRVSKFSWDMMMIVSSAY